MDRPQSFDQELTACLPRLRMYAYKLTKSKTEAEDAVHDAALKAMDNWERYTPGTNMGAWLGTILMRNFLNSLRKCGRAKYETHLHLDDEGAYLYPIELATPAPQEAHIFLEEVDNVIRIALNPMQQAVLWHAVGGDSYDDIAELLGCQVGTVKSRLNRARALVVQHTN